MTSAWLIPLYLFGGAGMAGLTWLLTLGSRWRRARKDRTARWDATADAITGTPATQFTAAVPGVVTRLNMVGEHLTKQDEVNVEILKRLPPVP